MISHGTTPLLCRRPAQTPCLRRCSRQAQPCTHAAFKFANVKRPQLAVCAASVESAEAAAEPSASIQDEVQAPAAGQQGLNAGAKKQQGRRKSDKQEKSKRAPNNDEALKIVSKVATGALLTRLAMMPQVELKTVTDDAAAAYRALSTVANAHRNLAEEQPGTSVLYAPSTGRGGQLHMTIVKTDRHIPLDGYSRHIQARASSEVDQLSSQIVARLRAEGRALVHAAGAQACAVAAKALVAARAALAEQGYELAVLPRFITMSGNWRGPDTSLTLIEQHVVRQELPPATVVLGTTITGSEGAARARAKLDAQGRVRLAVPQGALGQVPALLRALQTPHGAGEAGSTAQRPSLLLLSFHGWQRRDHIAAETPPGTHERDELLLGVRRAATRRLPTQQRQRPFTVKATTNAQSLGQAVKSQLLVSGARGARTDGSAEAALAALIAAVGADAALEAGNGMKLGMLVDAMPDRAAWVGGGGAAGGGAAGAGGADAAGAAAGGAGEGAAGGAGAAAEGDVKLRMFLLELSEMTQSVLEAPGRPLELSVPPADLCRVLKATAAASLAVAGLRSRGALLLLPHLRVFEGLTDEPGLVADVGLNLRLQRHSAELPDLAVSADPRHQDAEGSAQGSGQEQPPMDELRVSSRTEVLRLRDAIVAKVMNGEGDAAVMSFAEVPAVAATALEALCRARARLGQLSPGRDVGAVLSSETRDTTRSSGAAGLRTVFYMRLVPLGSERD